MPNRISADDILNPTTSTKITAQDVIDAVPREPAMQPHFRDEVGAPIDMTALDSASGPQSVPNVFLEQRPTGRDQNVLPGNAGFKANFKANFVEDQQRKIDFYAKALFPNDPEAVKRFGVRDGAIVYIDPEGNIRDVEHGAGSRTGKALAYTPEVAGSIIGSFATGNPVSGGALGGIGGKAIKQIIAGTVLDDPQTTAGNLEGMATEGVMNLLTGGLAKGVGKFFNKGRVVDFTPEQIAEARGIAQEIERRLGIKLDVSQASQDPILMALRKYAAKFPGKSAQTFKQLDEAQTGQTANAMQGLLDKVAKETASETAGMRGINAAGKAIKDARAAVSAEVKPLYDAAYAAVPEVSRVTKQGEKILDFLKLPYFRQAFNEGQTLRSLETGSGAQPVRSTVETLRKADPQTGAWESASTKVRSTGTNAQVIESRLSSGSSKQTPEGTLTQRTDEIHKDITRPSLAELDYTKRALDERIQGMMESGQRQRAMALKAKRDEFVKALDELPNQEWQAARKAYGEAAKARIEPLENGAIGVLARTENRKAARVASKMFTDPNITANEIAFARSAIEKADPEGWSQLTRQYLATTLDKSLKVTQKGETVNLAGKLYQSLAGTPEQLAKLRAAMPKETQAHLNDVLGAFRLIAATERAGSDTAFNQLVTKKIEGRFSTTLKMMRQPWQTVIEAGDQRSLESLVAKLADGLTDPAKVSQLRQVTKASPSLNRALQISSILGLTPPERMIKSELFPMADRPIGEPRRGRPQSQGSQGR
jgi:hypothetical protein